MGYRGKKPDLMPQRYPLAGAKNPVVKVGVVDAAGRKTTWIKAPEGDRYLGRFAWAKDGKALFFQVLSRDQKRVSVHRADPETGAVTELWSEAAKAWTMYKAFRLLERSPRVLTTAPWAATFTSSSASWAPESASPSSPAATGTSIASSRWTRTKGSFTSSGR